MKETFELLISNIKDIGIHNGVINNFSMQILLEHIINEDQLIKKFIELNDPELISNMMRLSLHVYKSRNQNIDEVNRLIDFWDFILSYDQIEMLSFDKKYKIYSWYSSFFELLEIDESHLQTLIKYLEKTKGKIRHSHSVFKRLFNYVGINDSIILEIILRILGSSSKNDIYSHTFKDIKDLMQNLTIKDYSNLNGVIEYSIKRGDNSIRDEFEPLLKS